MLKRFVSIFILFAVAISSCRVNNGDIGDLFGSWLLYSMTVDGETPEHFNPEETYWEFQNNIIEISRVGLMFDKEGRWGTWTEDDDRLTINYTHFEFGINPGTLQYAAPEWLGFPRKGVFALDIISRSSTRMILSWQDSSGSTFVYSLRKIW